MKRLNAYFIYSLKLLPGRIHLGSLPVCFDTKNMGKIKTDHHYDLKLIKNLILRVCRAGKTKTMFVFMHIVI
jgi:hypothetical protein